MSLSVVLLAEGTGDLGENLLRGPRSRIDDEDLGPAHVLLSRALAEVRGVPRAAIQFFEPNRTARGTLARGSVLKHRRSLRQLINYLPAQRPDLIIVLVDADGDSSTEATLEGFLSDMPGSRVIAVAVQEFETWLLDEPSGERLQPREAKAKLAAVAPSRAARKSLAETVDLDALKKRAASFDRCLRKLR
ncbi:MAG: hypothetical protein SFW67_30810 [Myxococcaceae bacterium]|nr:hypothetical protein [Myxococcaceae bacterium]